MQDEGGRRGGDNEFGGDGATQRVAEEDEPAPRHAEFVLDVSQGGARIGLTCRIGGASREPGVSPILRKEHRRASAGMELTGPRDEPFRDIGVAVEGEHERSGRLWEPNEIRPQGLRI